MRILEGILFLGVLAGCGKADIPERYPVVGELFVRGQPAAGAQVVLHPKAEQSHATGLSKTGPGKTGPNTTGRNEAWPDGYPRATVETDGKFCFGARSDKDLVPPGEYVVLVIWKRSSNSSAGDPEYTSDPDDSRHSHSARDRFSDPATSPLLAIVGAEPTTLPRFNLK